MSALLAALRISRRGIGRARARSALIIVMIGLPVLAVTAVLTFGATEEIRPEERLTMDLGSADAKLTDARTTQPIRQDEAGRTWRQKERDRPPRSRADMQALIGPGSRIIPMNQSVGEFWAGDGYAIAAVREVDLRDPMAGGMFPLVRGHYPQAADEVVVVASMKAAVGETLRYSRDDVPKRVVGKVVRQPGRDGNTIIGLPGSMIPATATSVPLSVPGVDRFWLVDAPGPVTWNETLRLNRAGVAVESRAVLEDPPPAEMMPQPAGGQIFTSFRGMTILTVVLGVILVVIEVVLLAGPAFAVGLRRRRGELALISAQGGSARHLKLVVLADGLTLGLAAAVLGAALGIGVARGIVSYIGIWPAGALGPFEVPFGRIALVAALAVFSGLAAAAVPAVQAARVDVVAALAGRRAEPRNRAGWPLLGLVLLVAGVGAMAFGVRSPSAVMFFGGVLGLLGMVMVAPMLVRLVGGLAGGLPLPLRLAVRDAARNRGRTAPAVVAVLAAAAAFSAVAVEVASDARLAEKHHRALYPIGTTAIYGADVTEESWRKIRPIVGKTLPGVPLLEAYHPVDAKGVTVNFHPRDGRVGCRSCMTWTGPLGELPAGGPGLLRLLLGRTDLAAEAALAEGKAVLFDPGTVSDGRVRLDVWSQTTDEVKPRVVTVPAVAVTVRGPSLVAGVMPVGAITKAGLAPRLSHLIVDPAVAVLTPQQHQRLSGPVRAVTSKVAVQTERGTISNRDDRNDNVMWIMAAFASVVALGGTFAAAGLAAADARPDLDTLSAVGARPGTRRLVAAGQAVFVAGLGVPLGLLAGLVPGLAMAGQRALERDAVQGVGLNGVLYGKVGLVLSVPWPALLAVGIGLPLAAALIAMTFAGTRVTPVRRTG
ncbi:FtsX-like permease family protein [Streptosporangium canum]|uniref:FtsX-like permease family protein n=1 Tax=Streptosporangium canum TaxID=324952 RepID=UPI003423EFD3